jgi:hypothetical protein
MPKRNSHFEGDDLKRGTDGYLYFNNKKITEEMDDGTNVVTAAEAKSHIDNTQSNRKHLTEAQEQAIDANSTLGSSNYVAGIYDVVEVRAGLTWKVDSSTSSPSGIAAGDFRLGTGTGGWGNIYFHNTSSGNSIDSTEIFTNLPIGSVIITRHGRADTTDRGLYVTDGIPTYDAGGDYWTVPLDESKESGENGYFNDIEVEFTIIPKVVDSGKNVFLLYHSSGDSPFSITTSHTGKTFRGDGNPITYNLPSADAGAPAEGRIYNFITFGGILTINSNGGDPISMGTTSGASGTTLTSTSGEYSTLTIVEAGASRWFVTTATGSWSLA